MNLTIPGVGTEPGPQYASDVNSSLTIIDQHDHSVGKGVQVTPSGLNINADLSIGINNLTDARTIRFFPLLSDPALPADLGVLYEVGVDLYYKDGAGNAIRITQGGSVAGSTGTITGLPSGTASASFVAGTFVFQAATLTGANIDGASYILRNNVASSKALTLSPPNAMAADYNLALPSLPAQTNVMTLDVSGNMGSITYDAVGQAMTSLGANAIANSRTRAVSTSVAAGGVAVSASGTGSYTSTGGFGALVSATIETTGRPVMIQLIANQTATVGSGAALILSTASYYAQFSRGAGSLGVMQASVSGGNSISFPLGSFSTVDYTAAAGTYTYSFQVQLQSAGTITYRDIILVAYEL